MRFLKTLTLNRRAIYDSRVALDTANNFTLADSTLMTLPKSSSVISNPVIGQMRYNTSTNEVEVYQGIGGGATWRSLRYKESTQITQQNLGNGDAVNTIFGPLTPSPPTIVQSGTTWSGSNIMVYVENVFQIFNTNYTVADGSTLPGKLSGFTYIVFDSAVPLSKPVTVLHGFDQ
jgi:hypothetical protein